VAPSAVLPAEVAATERETDPVALVLAQEGPLEALGTRVQADPLAVEVLQALRVPCRREVQIQRGQHFLCRIRLEPA